MKLVSMILLLLTSHSVLAKTLIISDIDDTIKRTNVKGLMLGAIGTKNQFEGMSSLYHSLINSNEETEIVYVTAAPGKLQVFGRKFLEKSLFPAGEFYGKPKLTDSTVKFKVEAINKLIDSSSDKVILIGDNGQDDVKAYQLIKNMHPLKDIDIYIHTIYSPWSKKQRGVEISKGQRVYFTAADLGYQLYLDGVITRPSYKNVINKVYAQLNSETFKVVPSWSDCSYFFDKYPSRYTPYELQVIFSLMEDECL